MLTAYDYPTAKVLDEAGIPLILVGDSLGNVVLGYDSTVYVTMDDMIHHCRAVTRGVRNALVIGDMPFMSYQANVSDALRNAGRFLQEGGCQAVKIEGGEHMAETAHRMVQVGIPVMGHIGLTPQSVNALGGYKVQGRTLETARQLVRGAAALEQAGCFSIVLEMVPVPLARLITEKVGVPTIGIGAGPFCDGQVQVVSDMLGLFTDFVPKHTKQYTHLAQAIRAAVGDYAREVREGQFPTEAHSFGMKEEVIEELKGEL
ncbi:MAG: 3-methyl-2-oxobutanoate hydroxymethyltransferase, partial [Chloroflexi bacterium]|nr:3-methyl-2-oxobutanoate hydroxymethyltransferase [Chloroflexota bacterium]